MLGWNGVLEPSQAVRYVTFRPDGTPSWRPFASTAGKSRGGGSCAAFGVPSVAFDGTTDGVSRDGKTLVLSSWTAEPSRGAVTRFAVLSAANLGLRRVVTLRGSFSFDALSPDGSTLYAIEYFSSPDSLRYRVRAVDLVSGRLHRARSWTSASPTSR